MQAISTFMYDLIRKLFLLLLHALTLTGGDREYTVLRTFFIRLIEALKREILK